LFYSRYAGLENAEIWSVELSIREGRIDPDIPEAKKVSDLPPNVLYFASWDISSDDKRFLVLIKGDYDEGTENAEEDQPPQGPATLHIISNWFTELNEKVPTGKKD
jgi:hypothetical protein